MIPILPKWLIQFNDSLKENTKAHQWLFTYTKTDTVSYVQNTITCRSDQAPICKDHNIVTHCLYCTGMVLFLYWCLLLGCCCLCGGGGGHCDQTDIENRLCVGTETVVSSHTPVTPGHLLHLEHVILDISDHLPCVLSQQRLGFICLLSQIHRRLSVKSFTCRGNTCTHVIMMW